MPDYIGIQERFELAEAQCGFMPVIILAGHFPDTNPQALQISCVKRVRRILETYPLLTVSVADRLTRRPRWQQHDSHGREEEIAQGLVHLDPRTTNTVEEVWHEEETAGQNLDLDSGPLWRISIYSIGGSGCFAALTLCHIITDGMGALHLFRLVFGQSRSEPGLDSQPIHTIPPRAEDTITFTPSLFRACMSIIPEILSPLIPTFLQPYVIKQPAFPAPQILPKKPFDCAGKRIKLQFGSTSHSLVPGLRKFGTLTGTGSVQSLLHTASIGALLAAISMASRDNPLAISTETPISLRNSSLHPPLGGNFTGLATYETLTAEMGHRTISQLSSDYNTYIHSERGRSEARQRTGMLNFIPDLPSLSFWKPVPKLEGSKVSPPPTGWEIFLHQQGHAQNPYRSSLAISNLGLLKDFSAGVETRLGGLWFTQSPMPWGVSFYIDVVSCQTKDQDTHLGIVVSWLDGAISGDLAQQFTNTLYAALKTMAEAGNSGLESTVLLSDCLMKDFVGQLAGGREHPSTNR
ncbi:hypothetical protein LTR20_007379 [Exophiala xenobiotica]|nr:hypothetical protein LTS06_008026 [Exophiala xenobiotica]KAK5283488.1 hypothetical protein LTR40_001631 [Exophiala xenobiotica]KAK5367229.1 hypothetical protein LTS13_008082 [Exophiala xenobiotica]KAK5401242.1 hypothetical protein LTR79_001761 [Exophiala xenobiotica]KAK5405941.1 hypothetical protein LTR90_010752 [Exophiala xenobiotica]